MMQSVSVQYVLHFTASPTLLDNKLNALSVWWSDKGDRIG